MTIVQYLTRPEGDFRDSVNHWKAFVGQPYNEWEKNGWIYPEYDSRGWFQWYCRFWRGRRCDDDDRQIGRWDRVAGEASGRWRRILLEKYRKQGSSKSRSSHRSRTRAKKPMLTTSRVHRFRRAKRRRGFPGHSSNAQPLGVRSDDRSFE